MPFIKYKGESIYFDTLDEAKAAIDGGMTTKGHAQNGATNGVWTLSRFKDYIGRLSQQQQKLLQELVKSPHGRTAKDLVPTLGMNTTKAFGPVVAAMSRHAKKAGIGLDAVMKSDRVDVGNETILEFKASPMFVKIAGEAGWKVGE